MPVEKNKRNPLRISVCRAGPELARVETLDRRASLCKGPVSTASPAWPTRHQIPTSRSPACKIAMTHDKNNNEHDDASHATTNPEPESPSHQGSRPWHESACEHVRSYLLPTGSLRICGRDDARCPLDLSSKMLRRSPQKLALQRRGVQPGAGSRGGWYP